MPTDIINGLAAPPRRIVGRVPEPANFVPVYLDDTGEAIGTPPEGDVEFGSESTVHALIPRADEKLHLGKSARRFVDAYFSGEVAGTRYTLPFGYLSTFAATTWLKMSDSVPCTTANGYGVARAGGIVGGACQVKVTAHTTDGLVGLRVYKNSTLALTLTSGTIVVGDVGTYITFEGTQARSGLGAAALFSAGDFLHADLVFLTFVGTLELLTAYAEIVLDT